MPQHLEGDGRLQRTTGLTAIHVGQQPGFEGLQPGTRVLSDGTVIAKSPIHVLPRRTDLSSEPLMRRSAGTMPRALALDGIQPTRRPSETVAVKPKQLTESDLLGMTLAEIDSLFFTAECLDLRRAFFAANPNGNGTVEEFISYLHTLGAPEASTPTLPVETDQKNRQDNAPAGSAYVNSAPQEELRRQLDPPASPLDLISRTAAEVRGGLSADLGQPNRTGEEVKRHRLFDTIGNILLPSLRRNMHSNSLL